MTVQLLNEHHLEFLSLTGGFTGSSENTLVKMPHCWKSHIAAQIIKQISYFDFGIPHTCATAICTESIHWVVVLISSPSSVGIAMLLWNIKSSSWQHTFSLY